MTETTTQGNVYGLNIHLLAFNLKDNLIHNKEKIRVSITTLPEEKKQHFSINPKDIGHVHHYFTVNVTDKTQKIIFVFRRKNFIQADPIIASTVVKSDQYPKNKDDTSNTDVKTISIFEPLSKIRKENKGKGFEKNINNNRKVVGQMSIQFEVTDPFPEAEFHNKGKSKVKKGHGSVNNGYAKLDNDENIEDNFIFNEH